MSDHIAPVITGLQDKVNQLTGSPALTPEQLAQVRKDMGGGIESAFSQANKTADQNSAALKQKGLDSLDNYTQYWYDHMRNASDYTLAAPATPAPTPQTTAETVTKTATDQTTQLVNSFTDLTGQLTKQIGQTQSDTANLIAGLQSSFASQQTDLLKGFQDAQAAQAKQMGDLTKQIANTANQTGQAQKKPNYRAALERNRALNSGGLSATMLTGPGGVAPGAMTLGYTSLLGG